MFASPAHPEFCVLIVEDDFFIADDMRRTFLKAGVDIAGPVPTIAKALDLLDSSLRIDAAVLDINLEGDGLAFPIADALRARGIHFVFVTGYDSIEIPKAYAYVRCFEKPHDATRVLQVLISAPETTLPQTIGKTGNAAQAGEQKS